MKITVHMKSGNRITLRRIKEFKTTVSKVNGQITKIEWEFKRPPRSTIQAINVLEIEAVTVKRFW